MVPLRFKFDADARFPGFVIARLVADVQFESADPMRAGAAFYDSALIDTGAGFLVLPHRFHQAACLKIHHDFGHQPYRVISGTQPPVLQRFVEVGLQFLVQHPDSAYAAWPDHFLKAKAYLLDADQRPASRLLLGLDFLLDHFALHLEEGTPLPDGRRQSMSRLVARAKPPA